MPLYEFRCPVCGRKATDWRKMAGMDEALRCACGSPMTRLISRPQLITAPARLQDANRFNATFYPGMTEAEIKEERKREDAAYEANWGRLSMPERDPRPPDELTFLDLPMTDQAADKETMEWLKT